MGRLYIIIVCKTNNKQINFTNMCNVFCNHLVSKIIHVLKQHLHFLSFLCLSLLILFSFLSYIHILEWNFMKYFKFNEMLDLLRIIDIALNNIYSMIITIYWYPIWINSLPFRSVNRYILDLFTNVILGGTQKQTTHNKSTMEAMIALQNI